MERLLDSWNKTEKKIMLNPGTYATFIEAESNPLFDFTGNRTEPFEMLFCNISLLTLKYFHTVEQRSLKHYQKDCFLLGGYNVPFLFK